ncbi:MAG TPA: hypothetical protein PL041_02590, partial [Melioribacteraceae bacterium]|nr:hypothetical protein [Melioribacteraceae bacterium]
MKKHLFIFYFTIFVISIFSGCSDDPSSTGSGLIADSDLIYTDIFDTDSMFVSITSSTYSDSIDLGSSDKLLIGKTSFAKATAFVRFYPVLPDSISTQIAKDSIIVRKCWVKIKPNYFIGDSLANFDFNLYRIKQTWSSSSINNNNYTSLPVDKTNDVSYNRVITDTLITFNIENSIALNWLKNKVDSADGENYGVMFSPTEGTNRIIGIPGLNAYTDYSDFTVYIEVEKNGKYIDTVNAYTTEDIHAVEVTTPSSSNNNLFLIGGDPYRTKIYFDISALPKNVIINKAVLSVTRDNSESYFGKPSSDTIFAIVLNDSLTNTINKYYNIGYLINKDNVYSGDITAFVQRWVFGISNQGIRLNLS